MTSIENLRLISKAKSGDRAAWSQLCNNYYPRWVATFHGQIGKGIRNLCDTEDLVQSAISDALRDIGKLRSEAAFYSWVSAIIRRKMAEKRQGNLKPVPLDEVNEPWIGEPQEFKRLVFEEDYLMLLDAMLHLFPTYPEPMAALYLKYFEKADVACLTQVFGKSERACYRLVQIALALIRSKLGWP